MEESNLQHLLRSFCKFIVLLIERRGTFWWGDGCRGEVCGDWGLKLLLDSGEGSVLNVAVTVNN